MTVWRWETKEREASESGEGQAFWLEEVGDGEVGPRARNMGPRAGEGR